MDTERFEWQGRGLGFAVRLRANPEAQREWSAMDRLLKSTDELMAEVEAWCRSVLEHVDGAVRP